MASCMAPRSSICRGPVSRSRAEAAASLGMPWSCDEGNELWGGVLTYPEESGIRVCHGSRLCRIFSLVGPSPSLKSRPATWPNARPSGEDASQGSQLHLHAEKRKLAKDFSRAPSMKSRCVREIYVKMYRRFAFGDRWRAVVSLSENGLSERVTRRICTYGSGGILWDPPNQGYVDSTPLRGESRVWRTEESLLASKNAEPLLGVASRRSVAFSFVVVLTLSPNFCLGHETCDDLAGYFI
ncbi:hypothetical protein CDL15_Pgr003937 [Punica granatum]|uniref:Uncharacterized protein n=1 Tax=Punica granatum TaxID=22663 RepID=A0A218W9J9_PUNGR|nr:hypothetical protein CDL15_Pgr003937 [Punica granatum]